MKKHLGRHLNLRRVKVSCQFRILHNKELCDVHRSSSVAVVVKYLRVPWAGHVAGNGQARKGYVIIMKNPFCRPRRWKDSTGIDINLWVMRMVDGTRLKISTGSHRHRLC
jgi:hypothetical protein